jgi:cytochrome c5
VNPRILIVSLAALMAVSAAAKDNVQSPQRAVPGAGWSAVPIPGNGGKQVFERFCASCHGVGEGHPGTEALQAKYKGALPADLTRRTDLTPDVVVFTVRHGVSIMPSARKTEISDTELMAIARYLSHKKD